MRENLAEGEGDESVLVASWGEHQVGDDGQHLGEDIGGETILLNTAVYRRCKGHHNDDHHPCDCNHAGLFEILKKKVISKMIEEMEVKLASGL